MPSELGLGSDLVVLVVLVVVITTTIMTTVLTMISGFAGVMISYAKDDSTAIFTRARNVRPGHVGVE